MFRAYIDVCTLIGLNYMNLYNEGTNYTNAYTIAIL